MALVAELERVGAVVTPQGGEQERAAKRRMRPKRATTKNYINKLGVSITPVKPL